jgi:tetratricopeptide (TPR) repeat protein
MTQIPELAKAVDELVAFAVARHQSGDLAGAEALYGKALSLVPTQPVALHNLGLLHLASDRPASAVTLLREAVRQWPTEAAFRYNLGSALQRGDELHAALAEYDAAVRSKPDYREAWENRAVVLQDLGRLTEAIDSYRQALRIDPLSPVACLNLPKALRAAARTDEALAEYRRILDARPLDPGATVGEATTRIGLGEYAAGWPGYEARLAVPGFLANTRPYRVPLPRWRGEPTATQGLLVYGEQGIGDEVMFASCLPDLAASSAAPLVLFCERRLVPLFARSFPQITVAPQQGDQPEPGSVERFPVDHCVAIGSLPQWFRRDRRSFPGSAYLRADPEARTRWQKQLAALGPGLKIGLSWRGGNEARTQRARSIPLALFASLFAGSDAHFINLQYGDHRQEIARFNAGAANPLHCPGGLSPLTDLDGFAALLSALDLVITIDNSTVHLAGSLGIPTWLLLPAFPDWRWGSTEGRTPWYNSVELLRQEADEAPDWQGLLGRVGERLGNVRLERQRLAGPAAPVPKPLPEPVPSRPLAMLVNDTAYWYHWGCTATSLALHEGLRERGFFVDSLPITAVNELRPLPQRIEDLDDPEFAVRFWQANATLAERIDRSEQVVVNGEGSLHGLGPTALALLTLAWAASVWRGKPVRIVNHSVYPADPELKDSTVAESLYRKVYARLADVVIREPVSLREARRLGFQARLGFDCLPRFLARHPVSKRDGDRRIVLAGSVSLTSARTETLVGLAESCLRRGLAVDVLVGANAWPAVDDEQFVNALHPRLRGRYRLIEARSEDEWLATLAGAELLISGRFHHTIAAACQRTPVAIAASNTRKIDGLIESLGLDAEAVWLNLDAPAQAQARIEALLADPGLGLARPETLAALGELAAQNFSGLAASGPPRSAASV